MVGGKSCLPEEFRPPNELKVLFEAFWNILGFCISPVSYYSAETEFKVTHQKNLICSDTIRYANNSTRVQIKSVICCTESFQTRLFSQAFLIFCIWHLSAKMIDNMPTQYRTLVFGIKGCDSTSLGTCSLKLQTFDTLSHIYKVLKVW